MVGTPSSLPSWAQWAQALGIPVFGLVLSGIAAFIAWQQKRIADIRLQHDLYDRRYKIFDGARRFLATLMRSAKVELADYFAFLSETSDAVFLLDKTIVDYLNEIRDKAAKLRLVNRKLENQNLPEADHDAFAKEEGELLTWISAQFDVLVAKFQPFLRLDEHQRKRNRQRT